jgi:hypothetical protein
MPFRWDIRRREQLGTLARGAPAESYPGFLEDLRRCCARVVAAAGDARLVFLGRSPESLFDYSSGALADTSWADRPVLLNVSLSGNEGDAEPDAAAHAAVRAQFAALDLDPAGIATSPRPVALIDLIYRGRTFGALLDMLLGWAAEAGVDPAAVRRRLRIVGITERTHNSPNTWRWQQQLAWAVAFRPRGALKGVSVPPVLWDYLGNRQKKVARSNPPWRWSDPEMRRPPREPEHVEALRLAVALYEAGHTRAEREALAALLAAQPTMRFAWLRRLVNELRGPG